MPRFDVDTTFRHARFRSLGAFMVTRRFGVAFMWKPWFFALGVERWQGGFGVYLGPLAIGAGNAGD